jgi:hypothetical protein
MGFLTDAMLDNGALGRRIGGDPWLRDYALAPRNLLTAQQASLEDGSAAIGWANLSNGTPTRSTAQFQNGTASMLVTAGTTGPAIVGVGSAAAWDMKPVIPGRPYTGKGMALQGVGTRTVFVRIAWYTSALAFISYSDGTATTLNGSTWTPITSTGVAPATAAFALFEIYAGPSGAISDTVYVDTMGFWEGAGGSWVPGGERVDPGTLGHYWDESVGRREFSWQQESPGPRWVMTYGDTGWRDVSATMQAAYLLLDPNAKLYLRRIGSTVEAHYNRGTASTSTGLQSICILPSGFRVGTGVFGSSVGSLVDGATGAPAPQIIYSTSGNSGLNVGGLTAGVNSIGSLSYSTLEAWPTALPGSAVGSIPSA